MTGHGHGRAVTGRRERKGRKSPRGTRTGVGRGREEGGPERDGSEDSTQTRRKRPLRAWPGGPETGPVCVAGPGPVTRTWAGRARAGGQRVGPSGRVLAAGRDCGPGLCGAGSGRALCGPAPPVAAGGGRRRDPSRAATGSFTPPGQALGVVAYRPSREPGRLGMFCSGTGPARAGPAADRAPQSAEERGTEAPRRRIEAAGEEAGRELTAWKETHGHTVTHSLAVHTSRPVEEADARVCVGLEIISRGADVCGGVAAVRVDSKADRTSPRRGRWATRCGLHLMRLLAPRSRGKGARRCLVCMSSKV